MKNTGAAVVLALLVVGVCWKFLVMGEVFLPANPYAWKPWASYATSAQREAPSNPELSDPNLSYIPRRHLLKESFGTGGPYLWNPYGFSGVPYAADPQTAVYYPPNLLFVFFDTYKAFGYSIALHLFLGGLFMLVYLRELKLGMQPALIGSAVFMLSGFMSMNLPLITFMNTAIWCPLAFYFVEKIMARPRFATAAGLGVTLSLAVLAGFLQVAVFIFYCVAAYAVFRIYMTLRDNAAKDRRWLKAAAFIAAGLALPFLITAVQIMPTAELLQQSGRKAQPYFKHAQRFMSLKYVITWFIPDFWGNPVDGNFIGSRLAPGMRMNYNGSLGGYLGLAPVLMAMLGLLDFRSNRRSLFFAGLAAVSLLLAFGTPLFTAAYKLLPGFGTSWIIRALCVYAFSMPVLAAFGAARLEREGPSRRTWALKRFALFYGFFAAVFAGHLYLAYHRYGFHSFPQASGHLALYALEAAALAGVLVFSAGKDRMVSVLLTLVLFFSVMNLSWLMLKTNPSRTLSGGRLPAAGVIEYLKKDSGLYRITRYKEFLILPPNMPAMYGIQDIQGYNALNIETYGELIQMVEPAMYRDSKFVLSLQKMESLDSPILDLLNAKYVLSAVEIQCDGLDLVYDSEVKLYRNTDVLPRAFLVPACEVLLPAQVKSAMASKGFEPASVVYLTDDPGPLEGAGADENGTAGGTAEVLLYTPDKVVVETAGGPAFLLLADAYMSGWKAYVNGVETKIYRADWALRAVKLGPGKHTVVFEYRPRAYVIGKTVSISTILLLMAAGAYTYFGKRRTRL